MKKTLIYLLTAAMVISAASCTKNPHHQEGDDPQGQGTEQGDNPGEGSKGATFTCSFEGYRNANGGPNLAPIWKAGDKIKIYGFKSGVQQGPLEVVLKNTDILENGSKCSFSIPVEWDLEADDMVYAMYPADAMTGVDPVEDKIYFDIPEAQDGTLANANICAARTTVSQPSLSLRSLTTLFKMTIPSNILKKMGVNHAFASIISGPSYVGDISGTMEVNTSDGSDLITVKVSDDDVYIALSPKSRSLAAGSSMMFFPSPEDEEAGVQSRSIITDENYDLAAGLFHDLGVLWPSEMRLIEFSVDICEWEYTTMETYTYNSAPTSVSIYPAATSEKIIKNIDSFGVLGYFMNGYEVTEYMSGTASKGQNVSSGQYYGTTDKHYWPSAINEANYDKTMSFIGYYGSELSSRDFDFQADPKVFPTFDLTITDPGATDEILVAEFFIIPHIDPVPMVFYHALSQLELDVAARKMDRTVTYTIQKVTLGLWEGNNATEPGDHKHQLVTTGTYSFGRGNTFYPDQGWCWDIDYTKKAGYEINIASDWAEGKQIQSGSSPVYSEIMAEKSWLLLPQYFKSMLVAITYKAEAYDTDGKTLTTLFSGTQYFDLAKDGLNLWQPGKCYNYRLLIDPTIPPQTEPAPYGPTPRDKENPSMPDPSNPDQSAPSDRDPDVPNMP